MPRHEQISPEEDLASYYGNPPATTGAPSAPAATTTPPPVPTAVPTPEGAPVPTPEPAAPPPASAPPAPPASTEAPPERRVAPVQRPMPTFPPETAPVPAQVPNAVLAAIISAILPGAGQIYAGQTVKGVLLLVLAFFTCMGGGLFNVLAAVDAFLIAQRKARGETVGDWQFF